ncbi:MAG TPA: acyl-CoA dehydrogenase family protein [Actinomycetota bacterium]|nr:acyl-CoA dehydrogenase family protein [Actinomycetota bacterium]
MDFNDSPDEAAFRIEVRQWLDANARRLGPHEQSRSGAAALLSEAAGNEQTPDLVARAQAWQRTMADGGWAGLTWPETYGGRDLSPVQLVIFNDELANYDVPPNIFGIGLGMIGPALIAHGTEEQKQRYLPKMLSGEEIWCQLWSEPNAGSDIASLQTRAVHDADGWVLNGQKVWTSGAHYSHRGLIIARTDPDAPKHRGITCFIVDMADPGVDARPLKQMTGGANFNEVFLTDVHIPDANRVGDVHDGWRVALTVLMNERSSVGGSLNLSALVDPLVELAKREGAGNSHIRQNVADVYIRARLLTLTAYRSLTKLSKGSIPGPEGSIAKLVWSNLMTDIAEQGLGVLGLSGSLVGADAPDTGMWTATHLMAPGIHLGGGTDEVMRNIIGERVLGLPKEPAPDKGLPFRELLVGTQR